VNSWKFCSQREDSVSPYSGLWCFSFRPQKPPALLIFADGGGETHMCGQSLQAEMFAMRGLLSGVICIIQANSSGYLVFSPLILSHPLLTPFICLFFFYQHYPPSYYCSFSSITVFCLLCSCDAFDHIFNLWVFNQVHLCRTVAEISGSHFVLRPMILVTRLCSVVPQDWLLFLT